MFFTESLVGGYKNPLGIEIGLKKNQKAFPPSSYSSLFSSPSPYSSQEQLFCWRSLGSVLRLLPASWSKLPGACLINKSTWLALVSYPVFAGTPVSVDSVGWGAFLTVFLADGYSLHISSKLQTQKPSRHSILRMPWSIPEISSKYLFLWVVREPPLVFEISLTIQSRNGSSG